VGAPLPQDRTDITRCLSCPGRISVAGGALHSNREDGPNEASRWLATDQKSESLSVFSYVAIQTLTLQRSKR
jgi:hypothetical protein